jgi:type IV pilus assembly protein PilV
MGRNRMNTTPHHTTTTLDAPEAPHAIEAPMKAIRDPMDMRRAAPRSSGFTLVEVLVSLLVISVGLLGVAKLVLAAMKANDSAYFRGQATNLAYAILDDMRANRQYALNNGNDYSLVGFGAYAQPATMCNVPAVNCSPQQIADYDIYEWKQRLNAANNTTSAANPNGQIIGALPGGDGKIVMSFPGPGATQVMATITIQWDDSIAAWAFGTPAAAAPNPMTFTLESAL